MGVKEVKYEDWLKERLNDHEFLAEYEALEAEVAIKQAMIDARKVSGLTEAKLSELTGIKQSDLMELESGLFDPPLSMLKLLARGMGKRLRVEFVPV